MLDPIVFTILVPNRILSLEFRQMTLVELLTIEKALRISKDVGPIFTKAISIIEREINLKTMDPRKSDAHKS